MVERTHTNVQRCCHVFGTRIRTGGEQASAELAETVNVGLRPLAAAGCLAAVTAGTAAAGRPPPQQQQVVELFAQLLAYRRDDRSLRVRSAACQALHAWLGGRENLAAGALGCRRSLAEARPVIPSLAACLDPAQLARQLGRCRP